MNPLLVKRLDPWAVLPVCAHPGEDLAFDLFACEHAIIKNGIITKVRTGVSVEMQGYGFLVRDRSSMAARGIALFGGVIDAGYRGEILINMTSLDIMWDCEIQPGQKIAQMIPVKPQTSGNVIEVPELGLSVRGAAGFGSTGA